MAYASIEISPVGEAEHPLVRVLHQTIRGDASELAFPPDDSGVTVIAHLEGNPLGYAIAEINRPECVIRACGVLTEYRRQGVGGRLVANAAGEARGRGCYRFIIECPEGSEMAALAQSLGFVREGRRYVKELSDR